VEAPPTDPNEIATDNAAETKQIPLIELFFDQLVQNLSTKWDPAKLKKDSANLFNVRQIPPSQMESEMGDQLLSPTEEPEPNNPMNMNGTPNPVAGVNPGIPYLNPMMPFYGPFTPLATWKLQMQLAKAQMGAALAAMNITTTPKPTKPPKPTKIKFKMMLPPGSGFPPGSYEF